MKGNLFFGNSVSLNEPDCHLETLLPHMPHYGIKGTICRIEVLKDGDDKVLCYYKVLYNHDGTINPNKIKIPRGKGEKNKRLLYDEYFMELKEYLELNSEKYYSYKSELLKKKIDKRQVHIGIAISAVMTVVSAPVLISTTYVGALMGGTSILSLYKTSSLKQKMVKNEKKSKFIKQYDQYHQRLVEYQTSKFNVKNVHEPTEYTRISSKKQDNKKTNPKTLTLTKKEAA